MLDASKPIFPLDIIQKSFEPYLRSNKSRPSSLFSNIPNLVENKKYHKEDNITFDQQPKRATEK